MNLIYNMKKAFKKLSPKLYNLYLKIHHSLFRQKRFSKMTTKEIMTMVYEQKLWGESDDFNSGIGSYTIEITQPYIDNVREFITCEPA